MTAPRYPQPTRLEMPFKVLVIRADPDFERAKRREVQYEFTGRIFRGDNSRSGAYAPDNQE